MISRGAAEWCVCAVRMCGNMQDKVLFLVLVFVEEAEGHRKGGQTFVKQNSGENEQTVR